MNTKVIAAIAPIDVRGHSRGEQRVVKGCIEYAAFLSFKGRLYLDHIQSLLPYFMGLPADSIKTEMGNLRLEVTPGAVGING